MPDETISAIRITAADCNGRTWDSSPFSPTPAPQWLLDAIKDRRIHWHTRGSTDYARWDVSTPDGIVDAGPGDWIERNADGSLSVVADDAHTRAGSRRKGGL